VSDERDALIARIALFAGREEEEIAQLFEHQEEAPAEAPAAPAPHLEVMQIAGPDVGRTTKSPGKVK